MNFKTPRIEEEWDGDAVRQKLKELIVKGERYAMEEFGKELMITDLIRTQEEQDSIYSSNPKYQERPFKSVHQYGRGADIRVKGWSETEIMRLERFFNSFIYDPARPGKKTCLVHDVGRGKHFHVQVM